MTSSASGSSDTNIGHISIDLVNDRPFAWYDRSVGWCMPPCSTDEMSRGGALSCSVSRSAQEP